MELDDAYSNAAYISDAQSYPPKWQAAAAAFRATHTNTDLDVSYGKGDREKFDLFHPEGPPKGLMIFVHGGYWLQFRRQDWSHLAAGAVANGWAVAMPSYDLCPTVSIADITQQIEQAVTQAATLIAGPIVLTGHSAGGHLVARMLDKSILGADIAARLQRVIPISPVADLRPLLRTSMNEKLGLTIEDAATQSPIFMQNLHDVPVVVWVGADERPAFLDQARSLAQAWQVDCIIDKDRHHFDVIDALAQEKSDLVTTLLA